MVYNKLINYLKHDLYCCYCAKPIKTNKIGFYCNIDPKVIVCLGCTKKLSTIELLELDNFFTNNVDKIASINIEEAD